MTVKKQFASFEGMITESELPVLVDFYATWCGPCQMMARILEQASGQLRQKVKIVKIDSEKYTHLASQYRIAALPTLILFKQGQVVDRIEGVLTADQLVQRLHAHI